MIDDDLVQAIVDGVRNHSKALPAIACALPWVTGSKQYTPLNIAAEVARVWATAKGALSTNRYSIAECMDPESDDYRVAYSSTVRRHLPFLPSFAEELQGNYNEPAIDQMSDCTFQSQYEAAVRLGQLRFSRSFGVLDGKPSPLYADSYTYGNRPRRPLSAMTPVARAALPMFRGRKRGEGRDPLFGGTCNGLEMLNLTIFDPVPDFNGIYGARRLRRGSSISKVGAMLCEALEDHPLTMLMGDKELGHSLGNGELLKVHDRQGTHLMMAVPHHSGIQAAIDQLWDDQTKTHVIDGSAWDPWTLWGMTKGPWYGQHRNLRLLVLFRTDPPKDESLGLPKAHLKLRFGDRLIPVFSAPFMVTFDEDFMHRHAPGIKRIFGHRWSTENVNKKQERHGTALPSKGLHLRHWGYNGSVGTQNLWQLWRLQRERARELTRWHPSTGLQTYLEGLRYDLTPLAVRPRVVA